MSLLGRRLFISCRCLSTSNKSDWSNKSCRSSSPSSLSFLSDANVSIGPILLLRSAAVRVPESVDGRGSCRGVVAAVATEPRFLLSQSRGAYIRLRRSNTVSPVLTATRRAPVSPYAAESSARSVPFCYCKVRHNVTSYNIF